MKYVFTTLTLIVLAGTANTSYAAEKTRLTGGIEEISADTVQLWLYPSSLVKIVGFQCDVEVCQSISDFKVGDNVLITLDADFDPRKLLSIRLCIDKDIECTRAQEQQRIDGNKIRDRNDKFSEQVSECNQRIDDDLAYDFRYVTDTLEAYIRHYDLRFNANYKVLLDTPTTRQCVITIAADHNKAFMESCKKNECGDIVAGGCSHLAADIDTTSMKLHAIKQCKK